jgi:oxalate decarboxylase/phosphoglucose isomerase-like protein (cupin superfamily)
MLSGSCNSSEAIAAEEALGTGHMRAEHYHRPKQTFECRRPLGLQMVLRSGGFKVYRVWDETRRTPEI